MNNYSIYSIYDALLSELKKARKKSRKTENNNYLSRIMSEGDISSFRFAIDTIRIFTRKPAFSFKQAKQRGIVS